MSQSKFKPLKITEMPCRNDDYTPGDHLRMSQEELQKERQLRIGSEAALCAIFNELERRNITEEVLVSASIGGQIDLASFWHRHQQEDRERLTKALANYSPDEKSMLLKILSGK